MTPVGNGGSTPPWRAKIDGVRPPKLFSRKGDKMGRKILKVEKIQEECSAHCYYANETWVEDKWEVRCCHPKIGERAVEYGPGEQFPKWCPLEDAVVGTDGKCAPVFVIPDDGSKVLVDRETLKILREKAEMLCDSFCQHRPKRICRLDDCDITRALDALKRLDGEK